MDADIVGTANYFHLTSFSLSGVQYCQTNVAFSIQTCIFFFWWTTETKVTLFPEFGVRNSFLKANASQDSPEKHCPSLHCPFKQCLFLCASLIENRTQCPHSWFELSWPRVMLRGLLLHSVTQRWLDLPSERETSLIFITMVRLHNEPLTWPVLLDFMVTSGLHSLLTLSFTGLSIW